MSGQAPDLDLGAPRRTEDRRALDQFLDMMSAERGAAANTLDAYRRDLADLLGHLVHRGIGLAKATQPDIEAYLAQLAATGLAPASRARKLSAIRRFFKFLEAEAAIATNPAERVGGPKRARALPRTLGVREVTAAPR